jgi:hypothetical protein
MVHRNWVAVPSERSCNHYLEPVPVAAQFNVKTLLDYEDQILEGLNELGSVAMGQDIAQEVATIAQAKEARWQYADPELIFTVPDKLTGGSERTAEFAAAHGRPCLHLAPERSGDDPALVLRQFVAAHGVPILNVAGSRA